MSLPVIGVPHQRLGFWWTNESESAEIFKLDSIKYKNHKDASYLA